MIKSKTGLVVMSLKRRRRQPMRRSSTPAPSTSISSTTAAPRADPAAVEPMAKENEAEPFSTMMTDRELMNECVEEKPPGLLDDLEEDGVVHLFLDLHLGPGLLLAFGFGSLLL